VKTNIFGILLSGLLATAAIAVPYAALAQDAPKAEQRQASARPDSADGARSDAKTKRPLTAQQRKMKDCGAKWQEEKRTKGVKGLEAWMAFRSECMKG
jgi:Flp pilus assembly protein TadB